MRVLNYHVPLLPIMYVGTYKTVYFKLSTFSSANSRLTFQCILKLHS